MRYNGDMRDVTWLLRLNIVLEFAAAVGVVLLLCSDSYFWLPDFIDRGLFFTLLSVSSLVVGFFFYTPSVFLMNIRRFPRVPKRALMTLSIPVLIASFLWLLAPLSPLNWLFVVLAHHVVAVLIAAMVESVQVSHSQAYPLKTFVKWFLLLFALAVVVGLNLVAVPIFLAHASGHMLWLLAFVWAVTLLELSLTKYYRAGVTYLAKRGYRPNAAVIITNELGQVLLCERSDRPGTIQTVQGGIDAGERPQQAAKRELMEELGLMPADYQLTASLLETTTYDWSKRVQNKLAKTGFKGQEQYFFLAKVASTAEFNLSFHDREFRRVWWGSAEDLLRLSWSVKRPGIEKAMKGFGIL
jgi:putative (di)nucleoside polyphosphate hydrolase